MDEITKTQDDPWLMGYFKDFDTIPPVNKATLDWFLTTDLQVFSEYLVKDIQDIQSRLKDADDEYLYYVCKHIFNIQDWINLMVFDAGFTTFSTAWEKIFEKHFGDKHILQNTYNTCFEKWVSQKSGQQQIGANCYNLYGGKLYYRNRLKQWFEVDEKTAFDLKPDKKLIKDKEIVEQLDKEYKETWYDTLLKTWEDKQYQGKLPDDFLEFEDKETTPEDYFNFSLANIKKLIESPVSITELERWNGGEIKDLEDTVKIIALAKEMVIKRREDNSHTLYLLRDCIVFYELQKTMDILESEGTSANQVLVGRKLLSHPSKEWGYYQATLNALYDAHRRYPDNFEEFYNDYTRLIDMFASMNAGFAEVMTNLANYINNHIKTEKNKIVVFDVGFQGSIALLTKYIIDHYINPSNSNGKIETDIKVGIVALWSKKLFGENRFYDDYFPFLNRLQLITRSNELYQYKKGSLNSGEVQIVMGDDQTQHKASIELVVLVIVALLAKS